MCGPPHQNKEVGPRGQGRNETRGSPLVSRNESRSEWPARLANTNKCLVIHFVSSDVNQGLMNHRLTLFPEFRRGRM